MWGAALPNTPPSDEIIKGMSGPKQTSLIVVLA